jgi:hypothetical protein
MIKFIKIVHKLISTRSTERSKKCFESLLSEMDRMAMEYENKLGADVDIAIDAKDDVEFNDIATAHFTVIKTHYPSVELVIVSSRKYKIISKSDLSFRAVELYLAAPTTMLNHHVDMVCGCYTEMFGAKDFILAPRIVSSMVTATSNEYVYFPSKSTPVNVTKKYILRGFAFDVVDHDMVAKNVCSLKMNDHFGESMEYKCVLTTLYEHNLFDYNSFRVLFINYPKMHALTQLI